MEKKNYKWLGLGLAVIGAVVIAIVTLSPKHKGDEADKISGTAIAATANSTKPATSPTEEKKTAESEQLPLKIGIVNRQVLWSESTAAKSLRDQLAAKWEDYKKEIQQHENSIRDKADKLNAQKKTMPEADFKKKQEEFTKSQADLQNKVQEKKQKLEEAQANAIKAIEQEVSAISSEIMGEKQITLIVTNEAAILYKTDYDITSDLVERLNKKLPKVEVKLEK